MRDPAAASNERRWAAEAAALTRETGNRWTPGEVRDAIVRSWADIPVHEDPRMPIARGPMTRAEIGELLGCSRERVRQIEIEAIGKLRARLPEAWAEGLRAAIAEDPMDGPLPMDMQEPVGGTEALKEAIACFLEERDPDYGGRRFAAPRGKSDG